MLEDFLHYVWKFQKFSKTDLQTVSGEAVEIIHPGTHNQLSGPDFFDARLKLDGQLWAGNVEIHIKSSDWYAHHHETDPAYDSVILHVVWEHDVEVFRKDSSPIPTLTLKNIVSDSALENYNKLFFQKKKWINCEEDYGEVDGFLLKNWLERLYFERLENKSLFLLELLDKSRNDWEAVLFKMLMKNFGLKINGSSFLDIASSFDFSVVRKLQGSQLQVEALFFGQAGLLDKDIEDIYFQELKKEYLYLTNKFNLNNAGVAPLQFFRLRPVNFPTIRLAQIAALYSGETNLFSKLIQARTREEIHSLFQTPASEFWDTHYSFSSASAKRKKKITASFIDLLIINSIVPIKFCYAEQLGREITEDIISLMDSIPMEENGIISRFSELNPVAVNAMDSQALLQLKNEYCDKNHCLRCEVGSSLLQKK